MTTDSLTTDTTATQPGVTGQISDKANQAFGAARNALNGRGEMVGQAKAFAKQRPWATAALAGVVGVALLNTLRGR